MDGGTDAATSPGPQTAVVINFATGGEPVYCVNVTRPFQDQAHAASGREVPSGDSVQSLIPLICSDSQAAGQRVFDAVSGGLQQAKQAVQAISVAAGRCAKDAADAVTAASISESMRPPPQNAGFICRTHAACWGPCWWLASVLATQMANRVPVAAARVGSGLRPDALPAVLAMPGAQDVLSPVSAIENFYRTFVDALQAVGLPGKCLQHCLHAMCAARPHPSPTLLRSLCDAGSQRRVWHARGQRKVLLHRVRGKQAGCCAGQMRKGSLQCRGRQLIR